MRLSIPAFFSRASFCLQKRLSEKGHLSPTVVLAEFKAIVALLEALNSTKPSRSSSNKASQTGTRLTPSSLAAADSATKAPTLQRPQVGHLM
jgi:hypothetical protein